MTEDSLVERSYRNPPPTESSVDLWFAVGDDVARIAGDPELAALLSPPEHARAARFRNAPDAQRFTTGRVLARMLLEQIGGRPASSWSLDPDSKGRPRLAGSFAETRLDFNITHTSGFVACALARDMAVGVDAEAHVDMLDVMSIAKRFFAPAEVAALEATTGADRTRTFFSIWTLKEAFVKALGGGLSIPLDSFAFDLASAPPACDMTGTANADPECWSFQLWEPSATHTMALAVRSGRNKRIVVRRKRFERGP